MIFISLLLINSSCKEKNAYLTGYVNIKNTSATDYYVFIDTNHEDQFELNANSSKEVDLPIGNHVIRYYMNIDYSAYYSDTVIFILCPFSDSVNIIGCTFSEFIISEKYLDD